MIQTEIGEKEWYLFVCLLCIWLWMCKETCWLLICFYVWFCDLSLSRELFSTLENNVIITRNCYWPHDPKFRDKWSNFLSKLYCVTTSNWHFYLNNSRSISNTTGCIIEFLDIFTMNLIRHQESVSLQIKMLV